MGLFTVILWANNGSPTDALQGRLMWMERRDLFDFNRFHPKNFNASVEHDSSSTKMSHVFLAMFVVLSLWLIILGTEWGQERLCLRQQWPLNLLKEERIFIISTRGTFFLPLALFFSSKRRQVKDAADSSLKCSEITKGKASWNEKGVSGWSEFSLFS